MRLILDTNILISSLIKDSIKRMIIIQSGWKFYCPFEAMNEINKYKSVIIEKSGYSENELNLIFNYLTSYIEWIPQDKIIRFMERADKIIGHMDKGDLVFIAAALSTDNDGIWSDDKHFKKQEEIICLNTEEVLKSFKNQEAL